MPLEDVIGYSFRNPGLLQQALSHRSFASEAGSNLYNERLEFLGDSILSAVVACELYQNYPQEDEGKLSKKKSLLVSRFTLASLAAQLNLGQYLYLGVGEESTGGRGRSSVLANALEALIGAIFLDGGYVAAERFVRRWCLPEHSSLAEMDFKSRLQEVIQKKHKVTPSYETSKATGPDHDKVFEVRVSLGKKPLGRGQGKNKKEAEQAAACDALLKLAVEK